MRRIDFISGNVNSYALIINGSHQLKLIKTLNDLATSIAVLQWEKHAETKKSLKEKKNKEGRRAKVV